MNDNCGFSCKCLVLGISLLEDFSITYLVSCYEYAQISYFLFRNDYNNLCSRNLFISAAV